MKWHLLKTWPDSFEAVMRGVKPFEVRVNDRDYQVGDVLVLQEFIPEGPRGNRFMVGPTPRGYTGRAIIVRVTYMITSADVKFPDAVKMVDPELAVMATETWDDDARKDYILKYSDPIRIDPISTKKVSDSVSVLRDNRI